MISHARVRARARKEVSIRDSLRITRAAPYCGCLFLIGCASAQLNYNALDLAGSVDDLLTSQIVFNLARFVDNPDGSPAQVSIGAGTVTTTNQGSLSLSAPLSTAVTTTNTAATAAGAVLPALTHTVSGVSNAFSLTPSATNQATQSWSLATDSDSDQERRLRALYRYATGYIDKTVNKSNISVVTPTPKRVCPNNSGDFYVNPRLRQGWLVPARGEIYATDGLDYIGRYGGRFLYTTNAKYYHEFVLFVLEATNLGSTTGQSGKNSGASRILNIGPAQPNFILPND